MDGKKFYSVAEMSQHMQVGFETKVRSTNTDEPTELDHFVLISNKSIIDLSNGDTNSFSRKIHNSAYNFLYLLKYLLQYSPLQASNHGSSSQYIPLTNRFRVDFPRLSPL